MTDLLEQAMRVSRALPPERQDEIARVVLMIAAEDGRERVALTPDERASIARSKASAAKGEFATDEQVRAVWAKHGL